MPDDAEKDGAKDKDKEKDKQEPPKDPPPERTSTSRHTVRIGGKEVAYEATAGTCHLKGDDDKVRASVFYVSYVREGVDDRLARPVTFAFNGGPGSSAVWLHMGVLGPRRVDVGEALETTPPPYALVDNDRSPLDFTDLVFIDPVSTGYSRPAPGQDPKDFHGVKEDAESVSDFIRLWLTRAGRWPSPKYLIGESYGTTRAAALTTTLQERHGVYLNGIVLVSAVLYMQTLQTGPANDLPYPLYLPSYAVTALYHGQAKGESVEAVAAEAEAFALGDYASALMRLGRVTEAERGRVLRQLAAFTGIARDELDRADLRPNPDWFGKELLRGQRRRLGRFDARMTSYDTSVSSDEASNDPSYNIVQAPYTAAVYQYLRAELGFEEDMPYQVIADVSPWKLVDPNEGGYLEVGSKLRAAMARNPGLRVLLMSGYYDLATPFLASEWTLDHLRVQPALQGNFVKRRYEAGHMMYVHEPSFHAMREDLQEFIARS